MWGSHGGSHSRTPKGLIGLGMSGHTILELAELCGATLEGDGGRVVVSAASLRDAGPEQISFYSHDRYRAEVDATRAAAVVCPEDLALDRPDLTVLRSAHPSQAFNTIAMHLAGERPTPEPGVHPTAIVHPTARVGADVSLGPYCVIEADAELGDGVTCHPHVTVGMGTVVGAGTVLHPSVVLYDGVRVGARCIIHAATVIGADGFGFDHSREGWVKVPQVGTVTVGDDVEMGAGCTVDRGRFSATTIGRGTKMDNQVHVAHNTTIGEHVIMSAQVGMAGTARIGSWAMLGGQSGINGHITVGAGAKIAGGSGVMGDVPDGEVWFGYPARPRREMLRRIVQTGRLTQVFDGLSDLERRVAELEPEAAGENEAGGEA